MTLRVVLTEVNIGIFKDYSIRQEAEQIILMHDT